MSETANKPRSRILAIQKRSLVKLVQNFFIRTLGHHTKVNFDDIDLANWETIASILNTLGPSKTGKQWKSSFYYMTNRIRKKVDSIRRCGGHVTDNLPELDLKIYEMSRMVDCNMDIVFDNVNPYGTGNNCEDDEPEADTSQEQIKIESEKVSVHNYGRVFVAQTMEEVDTYIHNQMMEMIEEDFEPEEVLGEEISEQFEECPAEHTTGASDESDATAPSIHANNRIVGNVSGHGQQTENRSLLVDPTGRLSELFGEETSEHIDSHPAAAGATYRLLSDATYRHEINAGVTDVQGHLPMPQLPEKNKPMEAEKTSVRIPEIQKERLVQLIQNNFLQAVGRFAGSNGTYIKTKLWSTIADELNTLGPERTPTQWKTTVPTTRQKSVSSDLENEENVPMTVDIDENLLLDYNSRGDDDNVAESIDIREILNGLEDNVTTTETATAISALAATNSSQQLDLGGISGTVDMMNKIISRSANETDFGDSSSAVASSRPNPVVLPRPNSVAPPRPSSVAPPRPNSVAPPRQNSAVTQRPSSAVPQRPSSAVPQRSSSAAPQRSSSAAPQRSSSAAPQRSSSAAPQHPSSAAPQRPSAAPQRPRSAAPQRPRSTARPRTVAPPPARPLAPPRARRNERTSSFEPISNINQFFNDNGNDSDDSNNGRSSRRSIQNDQNNANRQIRDRSNLRQRHTSYEQVQSSMRIQERFVDDANRHHSEMMFLQDRNHLEIVSMFTATLRSLTELGQEIINRW